MMLLAVLRGTVCQCCRLRKCENGSSHDNTADINTFQPQKLNSSSAIRLRWSIILAVVSIVLFLMSENPQNPRTACSFHDVRTASTIEPYACDTRFGHFLGLQLPNLAEAQLGGATSGPPSLKLRELNGFFFFLLLSQRQHNDMR